MVAVVLPCQPGLVPDHTIVRTQSGGDTTVSWTLPLGLESLNEAVHGDVDSVRPAVAPGGSLTELHPARCGEVGALSTVVAGVEARVVTAGKSDHDLSLVLDNLVIGNAVLSQYHRTYHTHFVSQEG